MTPRAVVSSVDEPPGRSDLGGRRTPQLQVRATAVSAEAGRGRRSESPQVKPTILTLPRPWDRSLSTAASEWANCLFDDFGRALPGPGSGTGGIRPSGPASLTFGNALHHDS